LLNLETSDRPPKRGAIGMVKVPRESNSTRDPNDNGSQFYICVADNNGLDRTYTVFGEVFRGMEVADKIVAAPRDEFDNPLVPVTMKMTVKE
jgi:peptidyl-prolyl cis-trans isomerase B (cyclophilin B)